MNWFEEAIEFDIYVGSKNPQVKEVTDYLFKDILKRTPIRNKGRSKETLKLVLLNLWVAHHSGVPVYYSRNPNNYLPSRRYGMLHVKYNRLIPIIDTLDGMGLIQQKKGWFDREKNISRQTRMYATDELIKIFADIAHDRYEVIEKLPPRETIQLKDNAKKLIDYGETDYTVNMRRNIYHYNNFITRQDIGIKVPADCQVNIRFLKELNHSILKGVVSVEHVEIPYRNIVNHLSSDTSPYHNNSILLYHNIPYYYCYLYYITDIIDKTSSYIHNSILLYYISTMTNKVREIENRKYRERALSDKKMLRDFGINSLNCQLKYELLHRVFNRRSFDLGGRFFGAYHIRLGEDLRRHITINGGPTVELDYSAFHIRMLYHMEGISYTADAYEAASDMKEERNVYKQVALIGINANNEKEALPAIRDKCRRKKIKYDLTNKSLGKCLENFKRAHKPIAKYLNSGIGLTLQNMDSIITEAVLIDLMKEGIACLPVHDSYIVEEAYKDILMGKMTEEYEKVMGFQPVIG